MKLLKHATAAFTANTVTAGAQYALVVLIARGLGPDAFGGFVFALAFGSLVAVLPNFGLDRILVRQVVRDRAAASSWFAAAGTLRLGLAVAAIAVAALLLPALVPAGQSTTAAFLIVLSLILALAAELCRSALYASEALAFETALRLAGRALTLGAAATAVVFGRSLRALGLALAVAAAIEAAVYLQATVRRLRLHWERPAAATVRALVVGAAPIACSTLFVLLYFRANVLLLTAYAGTEAAGQFGAAFTFLQVLQVASGSLAAVLLPHFVQREADGAGALRTRIDTATRVLLAAVVPAAATLALLAPEIVQLVYSSRYAGAVPALAVLAWAAVFMFMGSLHGSLLIAMDDERVVFWLSLAAAIFSLTANVLLIGPFGVIGASWVTVATEALVGLTCLILVRRRTGAPRLSAVAWPAAIAAAVAVLVVSPAAALPLAVRGLLALGVITAVLIWIRVTAGTVWSGVWQALGARGSVGA